jgi:DNA-binding response OmpR family regulator
MRSLLTRRFEDAGYDVVPCDDGWELLSHLGSFLLTEKDHEDIDIVVSDIRMPGVDGLEILRGAEACQDFPPMILITAFGDERTHAEAARFGAVAIYDKPFDVDDLIARVRSVVPSGSGRTARDDGSGQGRRPPTDGRSPDDDADGPRNGGEKHE